MADAQELVHYQNQLVEVYNQIDFSGSLIFKNAETW